MGEYYGQLSLEERCKIAELHQAGHSLRQIAAALDRTPSSISRELKRNRGAQVGYKPTYAQEQAAARRWKGSRLDRNAELRDLVLDRLSRGWSPEQIAGWLDRTKAAARISYESIYRFIYDQIRRTNDGSWRHYLPRAKYKRGRRRSTRSPINLIKGRVSPRSRSRGQRRSVRRHALLLAAQQGIEHHCQADEDGRKRRFQSQVTMAMPVRAATISIARMAGTATSTKFPAPATASRGSTPRCGRVLRPRSIVRR